MREAGGQCLWKKQNIDEGSREPRGRVGWTQVRATGQSQGRVDTSQPPEGKYPSFFPNQIFSSSQLVKSENVNTVKP